MAPPRYACRTCGIWVCSDCGWKRPQASVNYRDHACAACPSRTGTLNPTMHTERMWRRHNGYDTGLPEGYPFGVQPPPPADGPYGTRTAETGPEFYRGVRIPRTGPYARLDVASFKQGVDACLSRCPVAQSPRPAASPDAPPVNEMAALLAARFTPPEENSP